MKVGYIKLHRSSEDNVLYFSEPFTKRQARSDLLLTTSFKDGVITIRGNIIEVKRGQNGYSEDSLSERWQRSRGKVRRFLNYLETIQQIVQHKSKVKSIITIINYDKYQGNDTTDSTTDGQQTDTIKKYKKEKEGKEIKEYNNIYIPTEIKIFFDKQKENMISIASQIDKDERYIHKQAIEYELLKKEVASIGDPEVLCPPILEFIYNDDFRKNNIGSISKLRRKNKDGIKYYIVMLEKMKQGYKQKNSTFIPGF